MYPSPIALVFVVQASAPLYMRYMPLQLVPRNSSYSIFVNFQVANAIVYPLYVKFISLSPAA
jgi:hypothetical protein